MKKTKTNTLRSDYRRIYAYYDRSHKVYLPQVCTFAHDEDVAKTMSVMMRHMDVGSLVSLRTCELHPVAWWSTTRNSVTRPTSTDIVVDLGVIVDDILKEIKA